MSEAYLIEGRRLTGANFFCQEPAAILDTEIDPDVFEGFYDAWQTSILNAHQVLERNTPKLYCRNHDKGQSLVVTAPIDALYSSIEMLEDIYTQLIKNSFQVLDDDANQALKDKFTPIYQEESRPDILSLQDEAQKRNVPFLWDDDFLSLGFGEHSDTWPIDALPVKPKWEKYRTLPFAIVTGTNGKSTTTRLCSQILRCAGLTAGFSSTDGIWAGDICLDQGDYSGPGGAREVLRNKNINAAILEVARGGLLRRGLGAENSDVSLITNVAEDHLGEWGVNTLDELIEAKFIVRKALKKTGQLILNADDKGVINFARNLNQNIVWFSLNKNNPLVQSGLNNGKTVIYLNDDEIVISNQSEEHPVCKVDEIPICLKGAAKYNISNALAATALCWHLDIEIDHISQGLCSFDANTQNPGRGNIFEKDGASIMVDFAHNPHGLNAVVDTILQLPAKRRLVMLGHAGDRSNEDIDALTKAALRLNPDQVVIFELETYLRGREIGEIPAIITKSLEKASYPLNQVIHASDPAEGTKISLEWSEQGDFLLLLALSDRDTIFSALNS